jgi:hypothetical protein
MENNGMNIVTVSITILVFGLLFLCIGICCKVVVNNNQNIGTQQAPYTTLPGGAGPQQQYVPPQPAAYAPVGHQYGQRPRCEYDGRCHRQAPDHWVNVEHKNQDGPVARPKPGAAPY